MSEQSRISVDASDIGSFAAVHGLTPTGDPNEFWFRDAAGVYVAIMAFESAAAADTWIGTIYTHPERSHDDIVDSVLRTLTHTVAVAKQQSPRRPADVSAGGVLGAKAGGLTSGATGCPQVGVGLLAEGWRGLYGQAT